MTKAATYWRLGLGNVARVAAYRLALKAGLHPAQRLVGTAPPGPLFRPPEKPLTNPSPPDLPWTDHPLYFGWLSLPATPDPPRWRANPARPGAEAPLAPWWRIADFDPALGDIKYVWEASRLEWVVSLAVAARRGEADALVRLNHWLADWWRHNPPYLGPNWKCAQEASLRVLRLLLAAHLLGQWARPEPALTETIALHLRRIRPTLSYARAQQNNHATSEAAALWAGGLFLAAQGQAEAAAADTGKAVLERAVLDLVLPDGSFSQNSATYHRFMLDTVIIAESLRRAAGGPPLVAHAEDRLRAALVWLAAMTDPASGRPFNLGHNDSAYLLPYAKGTARDFRLTLGLGEALFMDAVRPQHRLAAAPLLHLLGLDDLAPGDLDEALPGHFPHGGYAILAAGQARALLRLPVYAFRPAHCDALHADLFIRGQNILRDGGTASYADAALPDLSATAHHNTVQFDGDDQMPRLSRYLWGDWLTPDGPPDVTAAAARAAYRDRKGRRHERHLALTTGSLTVTDTLSGPFAAATLRWRLRPGAWQKTGDHSYELDGVRLALAATAPLGSALTQGTEALHYGQTTSLPVIEARVSGPCTLTTTLTWSTP